MLLGLPQCLLRHLALADVLDNGRDSADIPPGVADRRRTGGYVNAATVLGQPYRFVRRHLQSLKQRLLPPEHRGLEFFWIEQLDALANYFRRRVAEQALRGGVPRQYRALESAGNDGIVRRLHDRRHSSIGPERPFTFHDARQ